MKIIWSHFPPMNVLSKHVTSQMAPHHDIWCFDEMREQPKSQEISNPSISFLQIFFTDVQHYKAIITPLNVWCFTFFPQTGNKQYFLSYLFIFYRYFYLRKNSMAKLLEWWFLYQLCFSIQTGKFSLIIMALNLSTTSSISFIL